MKQRGERREEIGNEEIHLKNPVRGEREMGDSKC
jgi:hypothetical protein